MPPVNAEQSLRAHQIDVAALNGILRDKALERGGLRPLFTDVDLLGEFTAGSYVVRTDFVEEEPEHRARPSSPAWARRSTGRRPSRGRTVIARFEEIIKKRGRNEDANQLKYWKTLRRGRSRAGVIAEKEFSVWVDWLTQAASSRASRSRRRTSTPTSTTRRRRPEHPDLRWRRQDLHRPRRTP